MQFPNNEARHLTERIMAEIDLRLLPAQHYNMVYEAIYRVLSQHPVLLLNRKPSP